MSCSCLISHIYYVANRNELQCSLLSHTFPSLFFLVSSFMKMGAKSTTIMGLSGTGDIMLTCFVNLSRNKRVGIRLGTGEKLDDILGSMNQVLENLLVTLLSS